MIKTWKVKVKVRGEHRPRLIWGIEEGNHELIIRKPWVTFDPESEWYHSMVLKEDYYFMDSLLKIGNFYIVMKREDRTHLYSANIVGISPFVLGLITNINRHTIMPKLKILAEKGYLSYTQPTRGETSEMNILLNEYTSDNHRVYRIEKEWLNDNMTIDKVKVIKETEDPKDFIIPSSFDETNQFGMAGSPPITNNGMAEGLPNGMVEKVPIRTVNVVNDLDGIDEGGVVAMNGLVKDPDSFDGVAKDFILQINGLLGGYKGGITGDNNISSSTGDTGSRLGAVYFVNREPHTKGVGSPNKELTEKERVDINSLSTWVQVVAVFYEKETGLPLTKSDVTYIDELLKISGPNQVVQAIKSSKVWRMSLPPNFSNLTEAEKKRCAMESQPGFFLKKMGMKHVFNFVKNTPRYRKDRKKTKSTGVISGLDEDRVREQQRKRLEEIKAKKNTIAEGKTDGK